MIGRTRVLLPGGVGHSFSRGERQYSLCSPKFSYRRSFLFIVSKHHVTLEGNRFEGRRTIFTSALLSGKTHYETLELTAAATPKEIKSAFYRLSKIYHPDLNPGDRKAEERFKDVSAAYNVLGDTSTKAQYDRDQVASSFSSRTSYSTGESTRRDSAGFSHESADWRYMDNERMMREQEEVWKRLKEHEEKFGRGHRNDFGFGHFKRTASDRPDSQTPPGQGPERPEMDRDRQYEEYMRYRDRKFGYDRSKRGLPFLQNISPLRMVALSFGIGLITSLLASLFSPKDLRSPYQGYDPRR